MNKFKFLFGIGLMTIDIYFGIKTLQKLDEINETALRINGNVITLY